MVGDLLPQGAAWPRDHDSGLMKYWRAFADLIKYADDRLCALGQEFFCETFTKETQDLWTETYLGDLPPEGDVDPACLINPAPDKTPFNDLVCAKMVAQGGGSCDYFRDYALALGWVVTCEEILTEGVAAGGFHVGCGMLVAPPRQTNEVGTLGCAPLNSAWRDRAADYPYPELFDVAAAGRHKAPCGMIGSNLGVGSLGSDCCNAAGYYEYPTPTSSEGPPGFCSGQEAKPSPKHESSYDSGRYLQCQPDVGFDQPTNFAHHIRFTVDVPASLQTQQDRSNVAYLWHPAGCNAVGNACGPLRGVDLNVLWDALSEIIPAHTVVVKEAIYT